MAAWDIDALYPAYNDAMIRSTVTHLFCTDGRVVTARMTYSTAEIVPTSKCWEKRKKRKTS